MTSSIHAYEIPSALICAECGHVFVNHTPYRHGHLGKAQYACANGSCKQFGQRFWHHFREITLDDKGEEV